MENNRRDFLKKGTLLGLASLSASLFGEEKIKALEDTLQKISDGGKYTLPALPYGYDALEPFIDAKTMEIHHTKHHQAYVDKLNKALESYTGDASFQELFKKASSLDKVLKDNAGGHFNHSLFWQLLRPNPEGYFNYWSDLTVTKEIEKQFTSFDNFKTEFSEKALKVFGSGWCWLIKQKDGKLKITTTSNQDNPLMDFTIDRGQPLLALDVWEHAYYLRYENKRADYIANWWNIINWNVAEELFLTP